MISFGFDAMRAKKERIFGKTLETPKASIEKQSRRIILQKLDTDLWLG